MCWIASAAGCAGCTAAHPPARLAGINPPDTRAGSCAARHRRRVADARAGVAACERRPLLSSNVHTAVADAQAFARVQSKIAFASRLSRSSVATAAWRLVERSATRPICRSLLAEDALQHCRPRSQGSRWTSAARGGARCTSGLHAADGPAACTRVLRAGARTIRPRQPNRGSHERPAREWHRGQRRRAHKRSHTAPASTSGCWRGANWHGGMTLDYLHENGTPQYIECNPRTVEPGNAPAPSGVKIAD